MAIDVLQDKIRKIKNPSVVCFSLDSAVVPPQLSKDTAGCGQYFSELLEALKGLAPAVRFSFGSFCLREGGLPLLQTLLEKASNLGYYVILDCPEILSAAAAEQYSAILFAQNGGFSFDGIVISAFLGSDVIKPFLNSSKDCGKDVFVVIRSANKSASELQDLLTGGRLVHTAAADVISRMGEGIITRSGYSPLCAVASATAPDSLRNLREKYKHLFLLVDGFTAPGANAKNCSHAFDRLGHGALVCSDGIVTAWQTGESEDYLTSAKDALERMRHNIARYVTVF
jgi:orotidine-5'-phosphate decarboxylase